MASNDSLIGLTVGDRYRIISQLGVGGMGTAYRAWDEQGGLPVVVKIPKKAFLEDPKFAERFQREIRLLQGFVHPHIVPIVDVGEHEGLPFVVMRFLPGGSLSNRRLRDDKGQPRPNPPAMLHLWLPAIATALDFIHAQGVVHRDVKPANIFFDAFWQAYLGDFGIAKVVSESEVFDKEHTLTATSMGIGTPEYMAPEQFTPKAVVDGRADQYALGVMVYEMLAAERPFSGATAHLIVEVMTHPVPPLPVRRSDVSPRLVEAVRRALSKRPSERFQTCSAFAGEVLMGVPVMAEEQGVARLLCPQCSNILKLPTTAAGQKGKCPRCQTAMKVADDLGAMWLLEEARRQEDAASGGWQETVESGPEDESVSDEQALEAFRPASGIAPSRKRRQGLLSWIDEHGLIVGGALAVAALMSWFLPQDNVIQREIEIQSSPLDKATIERLQTEKQAVDKKLAEMAEREKSLQEQLNYPPKVVGQLNAHGEELDQPPLQSSEKPPDKAPVQELSKRTMPDVFPIEGLRAVAGVSALAIKPRQGNRVRITPFVIVTGLVPFVKQFMHYRQRYDSTSFRDPKRDVPIWSDYVVERCVGPPGGAENWERIDLQAAVRQFREDWAGVQAESLPPVFLLNASQVRFATPRTAPDPALPGAGYCGPLPQLAAGTWGVESLHPQFLRELRKMAAVQAAAPPPPADAPPPTAATPDHRLFRFVDTNVESGKTYRYRVRLFVWNPNFKLSAQHLADATLAKDPLLASAASYMAAPVTIPGSTTVLVSVERKTGSKRLKSGLVEILVLGENPLTGDYSLRSLITEIGGMVNVDKRLNRPAEIRTRGEDIFTDRLLVDTRGRQEDRDDGLSPKAGARQEPVEMLLCRKDGSFELVTAADSQTVIARYLETLTIGGDPGPHGEGDNNPFSPFGRSPRRR